MAPHAWPRFAAPRVIAGCLALVALTPPTAARAEDVPDSLARFAPSSGTPWNPPATMDAAQPWETVARTPGIVAAIPFTLLGLGMKSGLVFVETNDVVPKVVAQVSFLTQYGLIAGPASLGDRTGWGGEVGVNPTFFRRLVVFVSGSTRGYNRVRGVLAIPYGLIEYQNDWRPQEAFFGQSRLSRREEEANYAEKSQFARLEFRVPNRRPVPRREL